MRLVYQRVSAASVTVNHTVIGQIEQGAVLLLGIGTDDTESDADLLAKKAQEVEALKENVAHYENRLNALGSSKKGILLSSSPIINRLKYCLMAISKRPVTDNDWQELKETVERLYPTFYHDTNSHGILSEKDYRTCLLVKTGFTPTEIDHLMGLPISSTSTNRQRLMKKVFGTEGKAKEFDQKILSI